MELEGDTPRWRVDSGSPMTPKRVRIQDQVVSSSEEDHTLLQRQQHAITMLDLMRDMHQNRQLCDVVLAVESKLIPAHRLVLSAFSPYFHAMFTSELRESKEDTITLQGLNAEAVEAIVHFAYEAKINITEENVQNITNAASVLQIESVRNLCSDFLKTQLHPSNCLGIMNFAEVHGCFDLHGAAEEYIQQNFTKVVTHDEFLQLGIKGTMNE